MKSILRAMILVCALLLCAFPSLSAQTATSITAPGATVERKISTSQSETFSLSLANGQFVHLDVMQQGMDVTIELRQPDQQTVLTVNSSKRLLGLERILWVAEVTGTWWLTVKAPDKSPRAAGRYTLKFVESRAATESDRTRVSAERSLEEGLKLVTSNATKQQLEAARDRLQTALDGFRASADQWGELHTLQRLGVTWQLSDWKQAREIWTSALPLASALHDQLIEARLLLGIGHSYLSPIDLIQARNWMERSIALSRAIGDEETELPGLVSVIAVYGQLGKPERSLEYAERTLALSRSLGDVNFEANILNNLCILMKDLGEYAQALSYAEQTLTLRRAQNDLEGETSILLNLGNVYRSMEELPKALEQYQQGLNLARRLQIAEFEARALSLIASIHYRAGHYQEVLTYAEQAMTLRKKLNDRVGQAATAYQLGRAFYKLGDSAKAVEHLDFALRIQRETQAQLTENDTLLMLATVERDRGNLPQALSMIEAALQINDSIRNQITSPELRASFAAAEREKEEFYLDLLLRLHERQPTAGHDIAALQASENRRARVLRELLLESRANIRQGVDVELLERESTLRWSLGEATNRLTRLLSRQAPEAQLSEARQKLDQANASFQQIQSAIRKNSPRYAALTQPSPLSLAKIQQLLDADTVLLEYALGDERSVLWAVTTDSVASIPLPGRTQIEAAASKCYDLLKVSQQRRWQRAAELSATELSRLILPSSPQLLMLLNRKRLVIVADGALQYIPFGVLPMPGWAKKDLLNSQFEVVNLPSASTLAALREENHSRSAPEKLLAVFADPVFSANDSRVKSANAPKPLPVVAGKFSLRASQLTRSAEDVGIKEFPRLPYSRQEAEAILALARDAQNLIAFDFAASRATSLDAKLSQYKIIHFATHGVINSRHPQQSGIALSLVDENGRAQDGFLHMADLYNMKLNADLVVLSACRTAMGKDIKGEGLIGLTRGFMYAGAPRIVASLWDVNDAATAELMSRFYRHLLKDKLSAAAALRAAQLSMAKEARWAAPYYWAGFVIQGDWQESK